MDMLRSQLDDQEGFNLVFFSYKIMNPTVQTLISKLASAAGSVPIQENRFRGSVSRTRGSGFGI